MGKDENVLTFVFLPLLLLSLVWRFLLVSASLLPVSLGLLAGPRLALLPEGPLPLGLLRAPRGLRSDPPDQGLWMTLES